MPRPCLILSPQSGPVDIYEVVGKAKDSKEAHELLRTGEHGTGPFTLVSVLAEDVNLIPPKEARPKLNFGQRYGTKKKKEGKKKEAKAEKDKKQLDLPLGK